MINYKQSMYKFKTTTLSHLTPNITYHGQTYRHLIKRIKEHEAHSRLDLDNPTDSRTNGHYMMGQNYNTHNYKIQETTGPHRTCSNKYE